jgi:hypothetical protein
MAKAKKAAAAPAVVKFNDKHLAEMIAKYKAGATIADLKRHYGCYGNPLVKRLTKAGVYQPDREIKAAVPVVKAKAVAKPAKQPKAKATPTASALAAVARDTAARTTKAA